MTSKILISGGAGYIGSHTWLALLAAGLRVVGVDDFSNSSPEVLGRLATLSGASPDFVQANGCDAAAMDTLFSGRHIDAVVHFAAESHVDRTVLDATAFVRTNVQGTQVLLDKSRIYEVQRFVHVSTDEVYGEQTANQDAMSEEQVSAPSPQQPLVPVSSH